MKLPSSSRFPVVDLWILAVVVVVGWATWQVAKVESDLVKAHEQDQEFAEALKQAQQLIGGSVTNAEATHRESELAGYDAFLLKSEYQLIAQRLETNLVMLTNALKEDEAHPSRFQVRLNNQTKWADRERDRVHLEMLDLKSDELQVQIASLAHGTPNSTGANTNLPAGARQIPEAGNDAGPSSPPLDLGALVEEIYRAYQGYSEAFGDIVAASMKPKPLASNNGQARERASHQRDELARFAEEARLGAKAITAFLSNEARAEFNQRAQGQGKILQAIAHAGSGEDFARLMRGGAPGAGGLTGLSDLRPESLHGLFWALLLALGILTVFLALDLYWRMTVMPLRTRETARATAEEHKKKLSHFEELAAGLAHEIRNPLTTINALVHTIERKLPEKSREHEDAVGIRGEIERINQMLKEFIQLARPSPPKLEVMRAGPLVKEVCNLMKPRLLPQAVRLECITDGHAQFYGDPQQLKQVLGNLVQNAAESMDGGGSVTVRARDGMMGDNGSQKHAAIIEVEDNGPGIRPEVQGRLFDPFFSTKRDGTGLGLPISLRIVNGHHGELRFETHIGKGTTFRIALPAYEHGK